MNRRTYKTVLTGVLLLTCVATAAGAPRYRSPFDVCLSPGGTEVAPGIAFVSDRTAGVVVFVDLASGTAVAEVPLHGEPTGLVISPDGALLYASEYDSGTVAEIDVRSRSVRRRFRVGLRPLGLALGGRSLVVANTVTNDISIVDLDSGEESRRVSVPREAYFVAATPDGKRALVGNLLPAGSPTSPDHAACVTLVSLVEETSSGDVNIKLPPGSTSVRQVRLSPDGRWAYTVHTLGRFHVPATQLDRGWINTNALSIIDVSAGELYATVLLDRLDEGDADPWGIGIAPSGDRLWVTLRGTHEVVALDLGRLHSLLRDMPQRRSLRNDLSALTLAGVLERFPIGGKGPRGIAVASDGKFLVVGNYYSGDLSVLDLDARRVSKKIPIGTQPEPDRTRRGEQLFHDATLGFQRWLSCSTCHPDRGRNDGLRWDLPNDGLGTPQMTRSLLLSYRVAPTTARGVRPSFDASVTAGFRFVNARHDSDKIDAVKAYLSSLRPERSPHLAPDGTLSPTQARGKAIFEGKGGCGRCHSGPIRTDLEPHDIGTAGDDEIGGSIFYTPKLVELYRTAPFLHDGRASDLLSVFRLHDKKGAHGGASKLSDEELSDLVEFLKTM